MQPIGLLLELRGPLEACVANLGCVTLDGQRLGSLGLLQISCLAPQLDVQGLAALIRLHPGRSVCFESAQGDLASGELTLEQSDLLAQDLEETRVLVALGAIAVDGGGQLLLGPAGAPVGTADGLLQAILDDRLFGADLGQLGVTDARGRSEERLGGDAGEIRDLILDERVVARGFAVDHELGFRTLTGEALDEAADLAVDFEVERDLRRVTRTPRIRLPHVASIGVRLAIEHQLERLLDARLARLVGAAHDRQPRRRLDVQAVVALEVGQAETGDAHT